MAERTFHVPILPHWRASQDVLLKALVANGGELRSALQQVEGILDDEFPEQSRLDLQYTLITDEGMEALASLTGVTRFESSKRMTDAGLVHLRDMVLMDSLSLNEIPITGDGLKHLAAMSKLTMLSFCECTLTDVALSHLPRLPSLTAINFTGSSGLTDAAWECLIRLEQLQAFWLNGATKAGGPGLRHLSSLPHLHTIDFSSGGKTITTDEDLSFLPLLPTVENLDLNHTLVTDAGMAHLTKLPNLKELNLEGTAVGDVGMSHLAPLVSLKQIKLERTRVTDEGLRHLASFPQLESINLNHSGVSVRGVLEFKSSRPGVTLSAHGCTGGPPTKPEVAELIRRPEYREAAPVAQSWARIEAWFAAHLPDALASLRPPASETDLNALEKRIGRPLPADFRASYLIHDGQYGDPGILFGRRIEAIAEGEGVLWLYEYRVEHEWSERDNWTLDWIFYPPGAIRETQSGPGWIPFYWDFGRNFIGIDLDPGPNGVVGQVIPFGTEDEFRPVLALSFAHLLEDIADELEAGNAAVLPPEVSYDVFNLKGGFRYKEWAEAKLPLAFQQSKAPPRFVPEDHATPVGAELAAEVVVVLRAFLTEMNAYERRWLAVRPIHEYGVSSVEESRDGIMGYWSRGPQPGEQPANPVQKVLWDEKAMTSEKHEALGEGQHYEQGLAEKRAIWARFLTPGERPGDGWFRQQVPPYYNPASLTDPDVRQVTPEHVIITFGQPRSPDTCGGSSRLRWHMRLGRDGWRIERHESIDDPAKPWKLDLP